MTSITYSISRKNMQLFRFFKFLVTFQSCVFQEIFLYHLSFKVIGMKLQLLSHYLSNFCRIHDEIFTDIIDISNVFLLSFILILILSWIDLLVLAIVSVFKEQAFGVIDLFCHLYASLLTSTLLFIIPFLLLIFHLIFKSYFLVS